MEDKELQQIISRAVAKDYHIFFVKGTIAGWQSCAKTLYRKCNNLTSAKAIKEILKKEANRNINYDITYNKVININNDKENSD